MGRAYSKSTKLTSRLTIILSKIKQLFLDELAMVKFLGYKYATIICILDVNKLQW